MLNTKQQQAVDAMRAGKNVFLTGKAGTGKSYALSEYLRSVDNVAITAPTGIAALNIGGVTCHRAFALPIDLLGSSHQLHNNNAAEATVRKMEVVVIDEISMVRADIMSHIEHRLRLWSDEPYLPYGGRQVIVVGDFYQLPPVVPHSEAEILRVNYGGVYAFDCNAWREADFTTIELDEVVRQRGDAAFIDALNCIRERNGHTKDAISWLNNNNGGYKPLQDAVTLCYTNKTANAINDARLAQIDEPEHVFIAEVTGRVAAGDHVAPAEMRLKVGAKVMLLINDPEGRFVNGTVGEIEEIEEDHVVVDGCKIFANEWEIKDLAVDHASGKIEHTVIGTISQLPIRLAWAITIHKSQGQTITGAVHMAMDGFNRPHGAMYVALSRATDVKNMTFARPLGLSDVQVDPAVRKALFGITLGTTVVEVPKYLANMIEKIAQLDEDKLGRLAKWLG